jgi:hypothetical protein
MCHRPAPAQVLLFRRYNVIRQPGGADPRWRFSQAISIQELAAMSRGLLKAGTSAGGSSHKVIRHDIPHSHIAADHSGGLRLQDPGTGRARPGVAQCARLVRPSAARHAVPGLHHALATSQLWTHLFGSASLFDLRALHAPALEGFAGWLVGTFFFYCGTGFVT